MFQLGGFWGGGGIIYTRHSPESESRISPERSPSPNIIWKPLPKAIDKGKRWKPLGQEEVRSVYERSPSPDIVPAFKMQEDKDAKKPKENVRNSPLISYPQSNSPLISFIHKVAPNKVSLVSNLKIQCKKELYLRLPKLLLQSGNEFSQKPQL